MDNGDFKEKNFISIGIIYVVVCGLICAFIIFTMVKKHSVVEPEPIVEIEDSVTDVEVVDVEPEPEARHADFDHSLLDREIDWNNLWNQNKDIYAWISVPGTVIDYPILQSKNDDDDYYLTHNLDLSEAYPGCIYSHTRYNATDFEDRHTVLYGHNMKNGTMFAALHKFEDQEFFDENRFIYIYMPEQPAKAYQIFACYKFDDVLLGATYDFTSDNGFDSYLNVVKTIDSNDMICDDALRQSLVTRDKLLTLSTCIALDKAHRLLVQAVEVE